MCLTFDQHPKYYPANYVVLPIITHETHFILSLKVYLFIFTKISLHILVPSNLKIVYYFRHLGAKVKY